MVSADDIVLGHRLGRHDGEERQAAVREELLDACRLTAASMAMQRKATAQVRV